MYEAYNEIQAQLAGNGNFADDFLRIFPVGIDHAVEEQLEEIDGPDVTGRYFLVDDFDELESIMDELVEYSLDQCARDLSVSFDVPSTIVADSIQSYGLTVDSQPSETGSGESNRAFSITIPHFDSSTHSLSYELDLCGCSSAPVPISHTSFSNYQVNGIWAEGKTYSEHPAPQEITVLPSMDCLALSIEVEYDSDSWGRQSNLDRPIISSGGSAMGQDYVIFTVQLNNTGNYSLTFPELYIANVLDKNFQSICVAPVADAEIIPGNSLTCEARVYVTESMVEDGLLTNIACAGVQFDSSISLNLEKTCSNGQHAVPKFFHFSVSQRVETGNSGSGSEENPLNKQLGEEIVWIWSVKNGGEQDVTILGWECDLLPCSSMINLSPDFCPGYSTNTLAPEESLTCSYPMNVIQDHIDAGFVSNTVTITAAITEDIAVTTKQTAMDDVWLHQYTSLQIETNAIAVPNQYTRTQNSIFLETPLAETDAILTMIKVTNVGNMKLYNVEVQEITNFGNPCLGQLNYHGDGKYLAPKESFYCLKGSSDYSVALTVLSQDHVDNPAGETKTATVQAWDSMGEPAACYDNSGNTLCSSSDSSIWPVDGTLFLSVQSSYD